MKLRMKEIPLCWFLTQIKKKFANQGVKQISLQKKMDFLSFLTDRMTKNTPFMVDKSIFIQKKI